MSAALNGRDITSPDWRELYPLAPLPPLEPSRTALLCIDLQYFDAHPDYGMGALATRNGYAVGDFFDRIAVMLPRVRHLQEAFRRAGCTVVHARIECETLDGRDVARLRRERGYFVPKDSVEGRILPAVAPNDGEVVFTKTTSSVFNSTMAHQVLTTMGIDSLVLCGVMTNACVELTARDAADIGYRVVLVEDCCAAWTTPQHDDALARMALGLSGITVRRLDDLAAEIGAGVAAAPAG